MNSGRDQAAMDGEGRAPHVHSAQAAGTEPRKLAVTTHMGTIGLLHDRGVITQVEEAGEGRGVRCHYRRSSGAEIMFGLPAPHHARVGDVVLVKSLTLPDGRVEPVAMRAAADQPWIALQDMRALLRPYGLGASRFIRWSAGVGSLAGAAAVLGLALPLTGAAAVVALGMSIGLHRRDRRDRASLDKLLE